MPSARVVVCVPYPFSIEPNYHPFDTFTHLHPATQQPSQCQKRLFVQLNHRKPIRLTPPLPPITWPMQTTTRAPFSSVKRRRRVSAPPANCTQKPTTSPPQIRAHTHTNARAPCAFCSSHLVHTHTHKTPNRGLHFASGPAAQKPHHLDWTHAHI